MARPRTRTITVLAATALLAGALALGGCAQNGDEARIAELEAQVAELQAEKDAQTNNDAADDIAQTADDTSAQGGAQTQAPPAADTSVTANYPEVADFETRTAELETACGQVTKSDDANANYQTYLDMKGQLDRLDDEMDRYDDQQEEAARAGTISYDDYIQIETALDAFSDRLDRAEDSMEYALGIYDD